VTYKEDLEHLEWYLMEEYDVHVSFEEDGMDEYWFDPDNFEDDKGLISIDSSRDLEHQLFVLLHEAGHVILRFDKESFERRFPDSDRDNLEGRIEILKEEVMAWDEAIKVAETLGININMDNWKRNYRSALEKYINWSLNGDQ
jgi:Zn-dependent peptidase ImmA (M78 family)